MRSIEQGRYLARAANTGISGFVDPYGRVLQKIGDVPERGHGRGPALHHRREPIYSRIGDLVGVAVAGVDARRARRDTPSQR